MRGPGSFLVAILLSLLLPPIAAMADTQQQIVLGQALVALNGPWKFHIGDDPQWANPDFDDSQWETVDLTPPAGSFDPGQGISGYVPGWTAKGHPRYWGYAWYRIRVQVVAQPGQRLAVAGPSNVDDAYQVFANGTLLGSFGKFRPGKMPVFYVNRPVMFRLPQTNISGMDSTGPATQVLAFRVWMAPATMWRYGVGTGGFHSPPLLGETGAVAAHTQLARLELARDNGSGAIESTLFFLLAVVICSLIFFDRADPVYRWLAAVFLLMAIINANDVFASWAQVESGVAGYWVDDILSPLIIGGWLMVWWVWFRLCRSAWVPKTIFALTLLYVLTNVPSAYFLVPPHSVDLTVEGVWVVIRLIFLVLLVLIATRGIRSQGREGWLALPAVVLLGISLFEYELSKILHIRTEWFPLGMRFGIVIISDIALAVTIFVLLLRRLLLSVRQQREVALDVKQAQEVQRMLIPDKLPDVLGLRIESEYRPAREVGGDFFQILPDNSDGSVLIVVGDVTGHGLQAGMLVALIVGAIRNQTETGSDPLLMLQALNRRLCGRGNAHATSLALQIEADGAVTLANAGHLPPYLNGTELPMEGSLPLWMIESAEFSVMRFQIATDDVLMLMSDGVAEAQDEHGQLFGFERIQAMLQRSVTAAEVATTAQNFGQEDDISVLSVTRTVQRKVSMA